MAKKSGWRLKKQKNSVFQKMFAKEQDEAIVLDKLDQGEADRVFVVLGKKRGKINLLAKGERKILSKLRPGIDLFFQTRITFIESPRRFTLTDVDLINSFSEIKSDWRKFEIATWISSLLRAVLPLEGEDKEIFSLTLESFKDLAQAKQYFQRYYYYFFWRLLDISGYLPDFHKEKKIIISSEVKQILPLILEKQKKDFYRREISPEAQKNLAAVSNFYRRFLFSEAGGDSLNFRL